MAPCSLAHAAWERNQGGDSQFGQRHKVYRLVFLHPFLHVYKSNYFKLNLHQ